MHRFGTPTDQYVPTAFHADTGARLLPRAGLEVVGGGDGVDGAHELAGVGGIGPHQPRIEIADLDQELLRRAVDRPGEREGAHPLLLLVGTHVGRTSSCPTRPDRSRRDRRVASMTSAAPDSSPVVHGWSTPRPAQPLHVPSSLRIDLTEAVGLALADTTRVARHGDADDVARHDRDGRRRGGRGRRRRRCDRCDRRDRWDGDRGRNRLRAVAGAVQSSPR